MCNNEFNNFSNGDNPDNDINTSSDVNKNENEEMSQNSNSDYSNTQNSNSYFNNNQNFNFDNSGSDNNIPPPKSGKWGFLVVASVMFLTTIILSVFLTKHFGKGNGNSNSSLDLPSHEYTSDVIEYVKIDVPKGDIYTDKTALYDNSQKSCVTVITTIKKDYYGQSTISKALGSGFVVSQDGYIVTNAHVVDGGTSFKVRFYNGEEADALLIGKEPYCDIAVLKIKSSDDLIPVSFGDSDKIRVGDFAMAIGTPSGEELFGTMTFGVISGLERKLDLKNSSNQIVRSLYLIQTDATLNHGNSGGPLFNMYGQVIGINTMKLPSDYEGIGFAIPSRGAVKIINSLISTGKANYNDSEYVKGGAQLGIEGLTVDDELKDLYDFSKDTPEGVLIVSIEKSSSAYKAGISGYDIICEFNGVKTETIEELIEEIQKCSPNDEVTVKIYRINRNNKEGTFKSYTFAIDAVKE